jgi:hypothetical protein
LKEILVHPIDSVISDHALITFTLELLNTNKSQRKTINFRKYADINATVVNETISPYLVGADLDFMSATELVTFYEKTASEVVNKLCPLIEKVIIVKDNMPWFDSSILALRRIRRQAEKLWRNTRTENSRYEYVQARRAVVDAIKVTKTNYYRDKVNSCNGDQRKLWNTLSNLMGKNRSSPLPSGDDFTLAKDFSTFFGNKVSTLRTVIDAQTQPREFSQQYLNIDFTFTNKQHFEFLPVTEESVKEIVKKLNKTNCLLDIIDVKKAFILFERFIPLITMIINKSFAEGVFPLSLKSAMVRPLLKKDNLDRELMKNYRPVSNLSFLSKVMESVILSQLWIHLDTCKAIPKFQSAYQKHHSTETALCRIYNDLVQNVCDGYSSVMVMLDLSAAFDTIDQDLLLNDLNNTGVSGAAIALLRSYLNGRSQSIIIGQSQSEPLNLLYGVPQGSVLGPILFIMYTASLSKVIESHNIDYHMYSDDTQLYLRLNNIEHGKSDLSSLLSDIKLWMTQRKLMLNETKTDLIIIRGNNRSVINRQFGFLTFGDSHIFPCDKLKNIGMMFDSKLSFEAHINNVVKKCNYHIRNLYTLKCYLDNDALLTLVHSLITSNIDYCNVLFYGIPKKYVGKLQRIMNRAVRLIFGLPRRCSITPYLIRLHWLPIKARIEYKVCLLTFKVLKFQEPMYLFELLSPYVTEANAVLRSQDDHLRLTEPIVTHGRNFVDRSFAFSAPRLYNALPYDIRNESTVESFKKKLKTHMFELSYNDFDQSISERFRC